MGIELTRNINFRGFVRPMPRYSDYRFSNTYDFFFGFTMMTNTFTRTNGVRVAYTPPFGGPTHAEGIVGIHVIAASDASLEEVRTLRVAAEAYGVGGNLYKVRTETLSIYLGSYTNLGAWRTLPIILLDLDPEISRARLHVLGVQNQQHVLQSTTNLSSGTWKNLWTNSPAGESFDTTVSPLTTQEFFRAAPMN